MCQNHGCNYNVVHQFVLKLLAVGSDLLPRCRSTPYHWESTCLNHGANSIWKVTQIWSTSNVFITLLGRLPCLIVGSNPLKTLCSNRMSILRSKQCLNRINYTNLQWPQHVALGMVYYVKTWLWDLVLHSISIMVYFPKNKLWLIS